MIELHQFPSKLGVPNLSPFCMKVEAYLNAVGLEYKIVKQPDPRKAPLGKLPMIVDGSETVADSEKILDYLSEAYEHDLNAGLSPQEKAIAHAFERMVEERLYWVCVFNRWLDENWPSVKKGAFGKLPPIVKDVVPKMVQGKVKRDLDGHGLGLHDRDTIYEFAGRDIEALANFLDDKAFFMGDALTRVDVVVGAFLCNIARAEIDSPMKEAVKAHPNLDAYQERMGPILFPGKLD